MENKKLMSIRDAARQGPLTEYALRCLLRDGKLPGFYVNKKYYVNYPQLLEEIDAGFGGRSSDTEGAIIDG